MEVLNKTNAPKSKSILIVSDWEDFYSARWAIQAAIHGTLEKLLRNLDICGGADGQISTIFEVQTDECTIIDTANAHFVFYLTNGDAQINLPIPYGHSDRIGMIQYGTFAGREICNYHRGPHLCVEHIPCASVLERWLNDPEFQKYFPRVMPVEKTEESETMIGAEGADVAVPKQTTTPTVEEVCAAVQKTLTEWLPTCIDTLAAAWTDLSKKKK